MSADSLYLPHAGRIVEIHDGDTAYIDVYYDIQAESFIVQGRPEDLPGVRFRFARINAPELSTPAGIAARDALIAFIGPLPAVCYVSATTPTHYVRDNYGRLVVEIDANGVRLNDWMLTNNYAVPYKG